MAAFLILMAVARKAFHVGQICGCAARAGMHASWIGRRRGPPSDSAASWCRAVWCCAPLQKTPRPRCEEASASLSLVGFLLKFVCVRMVLEEIPAEAFHVFQRRAGWGDSADLLGDFLDDFEIGFGCIFQCIRHERTEVSGNGCPAPGL
jgi:hypothetical protein